MLVVTACSNSKAAVSSRNRFDNTAIETGKGPSHSPGKLEIFGNGSILAYPAAQPAHDRSPVFLNIIFPSFR
jgi:hypothetical protein